ncbi:restriction endonuclease subunit S [Xanthomonas axonopodis pv. poinsettiicola]|uniref:restriction endonuclease subunit S n=1 Tax=Xanthomonas TaxID=338 RepID=UPI001E332F19|nr:restriction endonuclease subunit S [Xanthomonas codiaei]MCC8538234.1 restriction endonuclease subunit S [Xanthomonas codiaei]
MSEFDLVVDIPNAALWPLKSADSLCSLISRGTAPVYVEKSEVMAIGQRCVSARGFIAEHARPHSESAVSGVLCPESGDVLLNSTGTGTIGRSAVFDSPGKFIVDGHVTVMRPRRASADGRWLNSVLQTPHAQRHLERFCYAGSTNQLELSRTPLRLSQFPTPSLNEQEMIGSVVDTLDTAIHETEALIAKLKAVKQGLLHDLLTRGIDANGELRPPQSEASHLYKQSPVGWIPLEWNAPMVTEIADVLSGATPARAQAGRYFAFEGIPWVKTLDLNEDEILATEERITAAALRETSCTLLPDGAVLVAMYGGWQQIGRAAMLGTAATTNQAISGLVLKSDEAVPEFVLRALQHGRSRWQGVAASTRKDPNITKADVLAFRIPWPSSKEQAKIVRRFKCLLVRLGSESVTLAKLRKEKFGLMDDLLTGRVRVTPLLDAATA